MSTSAEDNSLDDLDVSTTKGSEDEVLIEKEDNEIVVKDGRGSRRYDMDTAEEVTSENMWERTDVLAGMEEPLFFSVFLAPACLTQLGHILRKHGN